MHFADQSGVLELIGLLPGGGESQFRYAVAFSLAASRGLFSLLGDMMCPVICFTFHFNVLLCCVAVAHV